MTENEIKEKEMKLFDFFKFGILLFTCILLFFDSILCLLVFLITDELKLAFLGCPVLSGLVFLFLSGLFFSVVKEYNSKKVKK